MKKIICSVNGSRIDLRSIKLHVLTDTGVCLSKEVNEFTTVDKNYLINYLRSLDKLNYLINPRDSKVLILNDKNKLLVLTIKENDLNWNDINIYRSRKERKRHHGY